MNPSTHSTSLKKIHLFLHSLVEGHFASHKSKPIVRASGYRRFVLYSTLGHVGGGNSC